LRGHNDECKLRSPDDNSARGQGFIHSGDSVTQLSGQTANEPALDTSASLRSSDQLGLFAGDAWDAAVVGGGFYGASLALELRSRMSRVLLIEREPRLLQRASYINQARVHNGYHYPRSILTSLRSRHNYPRFCDDFPQAIVSDFTQIYAVARNVSKLNAQQFERFCRRIGAEIAPAPRNISGLFNSELIEAAFVVRECAFDATKIAKSLTDSLASAGVHVLCEAEVARIEAGTPNIVHYTTRGSKRDESLRAREVFNCTYSAINRLLAASDLPAIPLRHELTEIALIEVPEILRHIGITVMDGPFFSMMPFPPLGLHSLSHVRYTPHRTWIEDELHPASSAGERAVADHPPSNFAYMIRDAMRFVPSLRESRYVRSLWEVKTILPRSEEDDSRPAFLHRSPGAPTVWSVVGAKIDGIYDVKASLADALLSTGTQQ
jgi:glycine/D-amino acid oxidase-like deaminating enzyme